MPKDGVREPNLSLVLLLGIGVAPAPEAPLIKNNTQSWNFCPQNPSHVTIVNQEIKPIKSSSHLFAEEVWEHSIAGHWCPECYQILALGKGWERRLHSDI